MRLSTLRLALMIALPLSTTAYSEDSAFGGGPINIGNVSQCISDAERSQVESQIAEYIAKNGTPPVLDTRGGDAAKYAFYPQAGVFWRDIFPNNFVDMNAGVGILDYDCSDYTYEGHHGIDSDILTWTQKTAGIPIYAALPGTVTARADGNFDEQTNGSASNLANYVVLNHGFGHETWYWHMKNGSVAVNVGNTVRAGQQLGLTASSGMSTGPHLHFESRFGGTYFEPFAGTCGSSTSNWVQQPAFVRSFYLRDLVFSKQDLSAWSGPPTDTTRDGWYATGSQTVRFWIGALNIPNASTYRIRYLRPDNSVASDSTTQPLGNTFFRESYWWFSRTFNMNVVGRWHMEFSINGTVIALAPIEVVASLASEVNRPPVPLTGVAFEPSLPGPDDAVRCIAQTPLILRDPDYDSMTYRYEWRVAGTLVRDVTIAATSDMLPAFSGTSGQPLTCRVTPTDGTASGTASTASTTIFQDPSSAESWNELK